MSTKSYQQKNYILDDKDLYLSKILVKFFENKFISKKSNKKGLKIYIRVYKAIFKFYKINRKRVIEKEDNDNEILFRKNVISVISAF